MPPDPDDTVPDGSEIRLLQRLSGASLCHCRLQPGCTSVAVRHLTVEELWYVTAGTGAVYLSFEGVAEEGK
ncbi:MAG TPA: hypothetical protein VHK69_15820 [Chitinophagaceae bacterium]|nr:hypothetical protein [Chitinophagaceae bacterium]